MKQFRQRLAGTELDFYSLASSDQNVSRLPITVKILLENLMRHADSRFVSQDDITVLAKWDGKTVAKDKERPFMPARVLLQDFTGVPAVVDLAAMRSAMQRRGGDPAKVDPLVPVDLVVDHSVQVDAFGTQGAYEANIEREYERNHERYALLRWAQQAFAGFRVVPSGMGICHQVNLEYLSHVVQVRDGVALPDTLVGTDSHTPMVNGIGVLGWGVGGIEAEAVMLGQPLSLLTPVVVGVEFTNALQPGVTATDLVLTLTEMLRNHGVVNKFVEFCGHGLSALSAADRATMANMSPEMGATSLLFPVDHRTLEYLRESGRPDELVEIVERYSKEQGMFRTDDSVTPTFSEGLQLDLSTVVPSLAGPRRPQDRVTLPKVWQSFQDVFESKELRPTNGDVTRMVDEGGTSIPDAKTIVAPKVETLLHDGAVVIAAITSCTNTSNPTVMIGAALLAQKAIERGLQVPDYVKTSLAPGSRVVTGYLERAGLMEPLDQLGFNLVGYGCTTCIGNSGPLPEEVAKQIDERELAVVAVLSGNRNFEGRIHPQVKASYLGSPPLVVAYALAGTVNIDLTDDPLGKDQDGKDVYLRDLWPSSEEINSKMSSVGQDLFTKEYGRIFEGDEHWRKLPSPTGSMFAWDEKSSYVQEPPFFDGATKSISNIASARVLALVGDSITTDHISPAGNISPRSPAAAYLKEHGVEPVDFNTYGARRGNHEVMMRGTFANIRLRNELAKGQEGGYTEYFPSGEVVSIYDAAMNYMKDGTPLIIIAGKEYGSGSSRDWAAKGPALLGVKAVIAQSFERIHRSNLVGMGILPLQFKDGESAQSLGLTGRETFNINRITEAGPHSTLHVTATDEDPVAARLASQAKLIEFQVICRLDSETDVDYFRAGGILPLVLDLK